MNEPILMRNTLLSCAVCAPKKMTSLEVEAWVNLNNPAGTQNGWMLRKEGDEALQGDPERAQCADDPSRVHIMFDC